MIRSRIAALLFALAFLGAVGTASAAGPEQLKVINTTQTRAWITLYADVGAFGWAQHHFATPAFSTYGSPWVYTRGSKDGNGPWKVRMEVTNSAGKKFDLFTTMWYDGSQHRFNTPGDPSTYLFVCEKSGDFYWSFQSSCAGNENTRGI